MTNHAGVRAGDEASTVALMRRLARQAVRRGNFPPPSRGNAWNDDDIADLIADVYDRKGQFVEKALVATVTDRDLDLYLLSTFENVLRDQARSTERGKLIERLKTLLGHEPQFIRHTTPYDAWRDRTSPDVAWQGDIGVLIRAARALRGICVTEWNTAGPTPKTTRIAIVAVCEAALRTAAGFVRDADVAVVVQTSVPAVPLDTSTAEHPTTDENLAILDTTTTGGEGPEPDEPTAAQVAGAIWADLTHDERLAVQYLGSANSVATALGLPRRTATAITESARDKIRAGTTEEFQADVVGDLTERSRALSAQVEGGIV